MSTSLTCPNRLLREIQLQNLLSFGPETPPLALENLNVLIGPNGSGKSNLIEALGVLRSTPGELRAAIRQGGGVSEWIWKGNPQGTAIINVVMGQALDNQSVRHCLIFRAENQAFRLDGEVIEYEDPREGKPDALFFYRAERETTTIRVFDKEFTLKPGTLDPGLSILAQRKGAEAYPALSYLSGAYERIRIFREWTFGRNAVFRQPQAADARNDRLEEDFSNLGLFLNRLRRMPKAKNALLSALKDLYEGISDFDVSVQGGTVQVFFTEGDYIIPAPRLSDGTLRYLCLAAILCDPEPPPLVCIEEPELGLHPDILPKVADLLVAASERTQLIVTTHSDILVDAMTERPEAVIVCEKHNHQTTMKRLQKAELKDWLERYRLGELWTRGELGGNRW